MRLHLKNQRLNLKIVIQSKKKHCVSFNAIFLFSSMTSSNIGSININGWSSAEKQFNLFFSLVSETNNQSQEKGGFPQPWFK